jgi:hypothetical protein
MNDDALPPIEAPDAELRALLFDTEELLVFVLNRIKSLTAPEPDESVSRFLYYFGVLTYEASRSASALDVQDLTRQVAVIRREVFEYLTRARYYLQNADVALRHWQASTPIMDFVARRLRGADDPLYQQFAATLQSKKDTLPPDIDRKSADSPNLLDMLRSLDPVDYESLYAENHQFPSAILHGKPDGMADVLYRVGPGRYAASKHSLTTRRNDNLVTIARCGMWITALLVNRFRVDVGGRVDDLRTRLAPLVKRHNARQ